MSFLADSDVEAELIASAAKNVVDGEVLEEEHADEVDVSYIGAETPGTTPAELIAVCTGARNALILTKAKPCWDAAKEIDKVILALERHDYEFIAAYDHGRFYDIAVKLLEDEGNADADAG